MVQLQATSKHTAQSHQPLATDLLTAASLPVPKKQVLSPQPPTSSQPPNIEYLWGQPPEAVPKIPWWGF